MAEHDQQEAIAAVDRAGGHIDSGALAQSIASLRERARGAALVPALNGVLEATHELFGCKGAGLMFVNEDQALTYVAATNEPVRALEEAQERIGRGPCVDSLIHDRTVQTEDLQEDERWPELAEAIANKPVRAVLGTPVHLMMGSVGSLNVYADHPYRWNDSEVKAIAAFARVAGQMLSGAVESERQGELAGQLQRALDSRVAIERATGVLMGREQLSAVEAFNELRRAARDRRIKVAEIAGRVLDGEWPLRD